MCDFCVWCVYRTPNCVDMSFADASWTLHTPQPHGFTARRLASASCALRAVSPCSYDISTIASVIPAFASRQDLLVIDDGASYPIQQVRTPHTCLRTYHIVWQDALPQPL